MTPIQKISNIVFSTYELLTENTEVDIKISLELDNILLKNALREIEKIVDDTQVSSKSSSQNLPQNLPEKHLEDSG